MVHDWMKGRIRKREALAQVGMTALFATGTVLYGHYVSDNKGYLCQVKNLEVKKMDKTNIHDVKKEFHKF